MKKNLLSVCIPLFFVFLAGCTSMDKAYLGDDNNYSKLEPLKLELAYEPFDLRIDINRRVKKEESAGMTGDQAMQVELVYTPIGFDIGNGVFVDTNFNISINILDLYDIEDGSDFTIIRKFANPLRKSERFELKDGNFTLMVGNTGDPKIKVNFEEERVSISRRPGGDSAITREDGETRIAAVGVLKLIEPHTISGSEKSYKVQIPLKKFFITWKGTKITFGNKFTVSHDGYVMTFKLEKEGEFRLIKIGDDHYFFNEVYSGFHISKEGNNISVARETRPLFELELVE